MKISDKTNTMLHASVVFLFLQPTINYLTLLWRKQLTPLSCGWNIGPRAILCYIYIFRRQSAIILCFEETFILVSFFKHSWLWVQGRKVSEQAITLQSAAPGGGREERSPVWSSAAKQRPEHGPLITVIAAAVIIWSPPVQAPCLHHSQTLYFIYSLYRVLQQIWWMEAYIMNILQPSSRHSYGSNGRVLSVWAAV